MGYTGASIRLPIAPVQLESRRRKWWQHLGWLLSVSLLVACNQQAMLQKFTSPEEQAVAKKYIDQLRNRDFGEIEKATDPSIANASLEGALKTMADLIPADPPVSVQLVGAHRMSSTSSGTVVNLTFEYQFRDSFVLANVATKTMNGVTSIVGFHVQPESRSLESQNRFTLGGKTTLQYGVLASAIGAAIFTLCVLVICIRTKLKRRKWLWILFILFGFGKLWVNWATGQSGIQVLAAQLFSASTYADFFGPWIISVSLPIGAIVFLRFRRTLRVDDPMQPGGAG